MGWFNKRIAHIPKRPPNPRALPDKITLPTKEPEIELIYTRLHILEKEAKESKKRIEDLEDKVVALEILADGTDAILEVIQLKIEPLVEEYNKKHVPIIDTSSEEIVFIDPNDMRYF